MSDDAIFIADKTNKWSLGQHSPSYHQFIDLSSSCFGLSFLNIKTSLEQSENTLKIFALNGRIEQGYNENIIEQDTAIPYLHKINSYLYGKIDREISIM